MIITLTNISAYSVSLSNHEKFKEAITMEEFYKDFKNKFSKEIVDKVFSIKNNEFFFDNQLFNYYLLKEYGVKEEKMFLNNRCTFSENFHSFRRDKELSGRNGAIIFMEE